MGVRINVMRFYSSDNSLLIKRYMDDVGAGKSRGVSPLQCWKENLFWKVSEAPGKD